MTAGSALVTGALGDTGKAICQQLLTDGWEVVVSDILPEEEGAGFVQQLWPTGAATYRHLNVQDAESCLAVVNSIPDLRAYVGNAGIGRPQPFASMDDETLRRQFDVNVSGNVCLARVAAESMRSSSADCSIAFTVSWVGDRPWPELVAYAATKAALHMATRSIALELASIGIRVNAVAPGIVNAGMARTEAERNPGHKQRAGAAVPLGRLQDPQDVAEVVAFLVSKRARNITGSVILVDGGCSLGSF
ncbi:MAG: classical family protein [Pseudonocardiales bacterium]|nr:classical family protein [Pseudonocardiales bacterium]